MAERAVRAVKKPQRPSNAYLLQQRRAARDVPLCGPRLRLAWIAFGVGLASVLLSLCLMIGGAASSSTVYGGKGSSNLTAVYVGIVFLIIGLAALVFFGFRFARVRQSLKSEYIGRDSGHDNAAFPVSDAGQDIPMTSVPPKFSAPSLPGSPNDSAYSSLALASNTGSELSARRLQQTNSRNAPETGQYHRVNANEHGQPVGGSRRPPPSTNHPHDSRGSEQTPSQRPQPLSYYPDRQGSMGGQPSPNYPSQTRQGPMGGQPSTNYPSQTRQGPTGYTNRAHLYTDYQDEPRAQSMNQPPTSQQRSGRQQSSTESRPGVHSGRLNSSTIGVSDNAQTSHGHSSHTQGQRIHHSIPVRVERYPSPTPRHEVSHEPNTNNNISDNQNAGTYDSISSATII